MTGIIIGDRCHPERSEGAGALRFVRRLGSGSLAMLGMTLHQPAVAPLAAQQTNAERILSGRDTPSHDYDLIHQRIEVRNFDWDATAFDGKVTTTIVSLRPGLDSIVLDMGRRLAVRSVNGSVVRRGGRAVPLRFSRPGDSISIRLPKPAG
ncbi:MAG TPA: hypothetical protein VMS62_11935, partial [Gemmatimonadales bacterium]|nr:hypothetical protein [Gemmatimonadales bacterium]